ncbi:MAG: SAM-dependent methyltransferase [Chthoniobacterales bacterium]|nr:SAM-dependent methyltransferase [Chthoniobacterales bacterium]
MHPIFEKILAQQAAWGGVLPWREYMSLALYDPEFGYYSQSIKSIGRRGDFSTFSSFKEDRDLITVSIKNWIKRTKKAKKPLRSAPLCELGPGNGDLAFDLLKTMGLRGWLERLHLVESSKRLITIQKEKLRFRRASWWNSPQEVLNKSGGKGIFFCNEFVDAFPCSLWQLTTDGWKEVGLKIDGQQIEEVLLEPASLPESNVFRHCGFGIGQRVETHESFLIWFKKWSMLAKNCVFLIIDYGGDVERIYRRRPQGTLRSYFRHERRNWPGVCFFPGMQDITADVNFDDLVSWAKKLGWEVNSFVSLREFVLANARRKETTSSQHHGFDEFFVLELHRHYN